MATARMLSDEELMAKCKNLCLQKDPSSETISQREKLSQHGPGRLQVVDPISSSG